MHHTCCRNSHPCIYSFLDEYEIGEFETNACLKQAYTSDYQHLAFRPFGPDIITHALTENGVPAKIAKQMTVFLSDVQGNNYIYGIIFVRGALGIGLKEAKELMDSAFRSGYDEQ